MNQKILVVEDDAILRKVLLEKLSKSGYVTEGAEDGEVALTKLRGGLKPDLILLDILMPRKNGMEVMEEMNADPMLKGIPIIIISNSGQPVEIDLAKKLGARDFLVKAVFDPAEVIEKVQALLDKEDKTADSAALDTPKAVEQTADAPHATIREQAVQQSSVANEKLKGRGVLVVEDDKFLRELFVRKLASAGLEVKSAVDAKGVFETLEHWKPNLILLDLILPDVDGFEILSRLKKDERFAPIPVTILSNLGEQKDVDRALSLGAQGFMVKVNFNLEEIVSHVQEILLG